MAKKRHHRPATVANAGNSPTSSAMAPPAVVLEATTAKAVLQAALDGLDAVSIESQHHQRKLRAAHPSEDGVTEVVATATSGDVVGMKRSRSAAEVAQQPDRTDEVYAAMSCGHYETICTAVAAFGLQLLPSLDDIIRRVGLAVATPLLASAESWETAAMICTYYRAGSLRLLEELLEMLLREPGVFLLDAGCVVPACLSVTSSGCRTTNSAANMSPMPADVIVYEHRVRRKLQALCQMLLATGPCLPPAKLQQVALRIATEVVEQGILAHRQDDEASHLAASPPHGGTTAAVPLLRWRVPVTWQADCLHLLRTLLLVCKPIPSEVSVCAMRVVQEVMASLHRGSVVRPATASAPDQDATTAREESSVSTDPLLPKFSSRRDLLVAAVELQAALCVWRHPAVATQYTVPQPVVERIKRRVFVVDDTPHPTPTTVGGMECSAVSTPSPVASVAAPHRAGADVVAQAPVVPPPEPGPVATAPSQRPPPTRQHCTPVAPTILSEADDLPDIDMTD